MTSLLVISATGPSRYICWPAGRTTRHSPGRLDGEIKGWIGWERIQAPNPSVTFLTLLSHGTLHQRFVCCNVLFWISVVWFSCLPGLLLTPRPLSRPDSQRSIIFRLPSISSARRHERQVGTGSEATAGTAFRRFRVIPLTLLWVGHILLKQPFIAKMCSACQGAQLPHTFTALKALISFCLCYSGTSLQAVREQYEPGRTNSMSLVEQS